MCSRTSGSQAARERRQEGCEATDTERLDWYFAQERFQIRRKEGAYQLVDRLGPMFPDFQLYASYREAIDHAMELGGGDAG